MQKKPLAFRTALYHIQEAELANALQIIGKRVGIRNKVQREKLMRGIQIFQSRSINRENGDSLYIRTHLKDGIQKAIFMDGEHITEDVIRQNEILTPSTAIMSIRYGQSEGYYDIEVFIPI